MSESNRQWSAHELARALQEHPDYLVLLVPEAFLYPSPWCDSFRIEVSDEHRVVRLLGDFT